MEGGAGLDQKSEKNEPNSTRSGDPSSVSCNSLSCGSTRVEIRLSSAEKPRFPELGSINPNLLSPDDALRKNPLNSPGQRKRRVTFENKVFIQDNSRES